MPHVKPAPIQPVNALAANMYGTMIARRRTSSGSGPAAQSGRPRGRAQREPHTTPAETSAPKATTKKMISAFEICAPNCGAVKSTKRK
jgi:hypothetical protein